MNPQLWQEDPWLQYLPDLHRVLAAPELTTGLPRSFVSLNHEKSCAWWETLRYVFRSLLGWRCLPAGLAWWYESGKPTHEDPLLRIVVERWDTRGELDYFAAREWESGGLALMSGDESKWRISGYEPSPGWLGQLRERPQLLEHSPYAGGCNPLHLGHSDMLGEQSPHGPSTGHHSVATRRATLVVSSFDSWQQELLTFGASLPPLAGRSWHVEVFERRTGYLGLFRQSRVTGLWFQGKHSIHMAGNPQQSNIALEPPSSK